MKGFIKTYYKEIIQVVLGLLLVFLLVRTFTPAPDKSELLKYKLDQLDKNINKMKQLQLLPIKVGKEYNLAFRKDLIQQI